MKKDGIIVILAYPETFVSQTQFWYRPIFELVGLGKNGKIRAGHAAALIIDKNSRKVEYTDFGRYITPKGLGRARTSETDPELKFNLIAEFDESGNLQNFESILKHIYQYPEKTHGHGPMYASLVDGVDYHKCKDFIEICQKNKEGQAYGPFDLQGSNCSRFVRDLIYYGKENKTTPLLNRLKRLSPSPLGNVYFMGDRSQCYYLNGSTKKIDKFPQFEPFFKLFGSKVNHKNYAEQKVDVQKQFPNAQWLAGIGAGAWFDISESNEGFNIKRIDQDGSVIFDLPFNTNESFDLESNYKFKYGTNARRAIVEQGNKELEFYCKSL